MTKKFRYSELKQLAIDYLEDGALYSAKNCIEDMIEIEEKMNK